MRKALSINGLILLLALICCSCGYSKTLPVVATPAPIVESGRHPANNRQHEASVWMGCDADKLNFLIRSVNSRSNQTDYHLWLSEVENTDIKKLYSLKKDRPISIVGSSNGFLYYWEDGGLHDEDVLYCYSINNKTEIILYSGSRHGHKTTYFANDGSVYIPLKVEHKKVPQFLHILGDELLAVTSLKEGYKLGDRTYAVVSEYGDAVERIICTTMNGMQEELQLGLAYTRSVIPCNDGLLIHNEGCTDLLYWIDKDGNINNIFSVPCMSSISAVNVCGKDVYISFMRFEKYGDYGRLRYENDTLEGTYRINLTSYTTEKINDQIFNGIYNFDDTCLYCCDEEGNIFKMNLNGEIVPLLTAK